MNFDGKTFGEMYRDPLKWEYRYLRWIKREKVLDDKPELRRAMEEFKRRYFPAPQDYIFTFEKHIGKTFPEVSKSYVSEMNTPRYMNQHPGLKAAMEYWKDAAPASPRGKTGSAKKGSKKRKRGTR